MKKNTTILAAVVIVALLGFGTYGYSQRNNSSSKTGNMMSTPARNSEAVEPNTSSAAYKQFAELKGEDYDRMFLSNMIAHHQGAVDMANLALTTAKHQELKTLAKDIISAQTSEITNMTDWQKTWSYPATSGAMMMDHSAMGMEDENAGMMTMLKGKTGDEFDKAFLAQMMMHHQSAINMAATGKANAQHQEVKDLTVAIVTAQTKEIKQMRQWQKDWKYDAEMIDNSKHDMNNM